MENEKVLLGNIHVRNAWQVPEAQALRGFRLGFSPV
jgi:hypothetical protein